MEFDDLEKKRLLHQHWLCKHPHYTPAGLTEKYSLVVDWLYEGYRRIYRDGDRETALECADYLLRDDIRQQKKIDYMGLKIQAIEKNLLQVSSSSTDELWAFITVGFNEQTITDKKMKDVSARISELKYFKSCYYVLEKHRENGIHHHTHFLVDLYEPQYKSKLVDWIYQTRGVRDVCLHKNFIDVKGPKFCKHLADYQSYGLYYKYIHGEKKEGKMKYVELDREWRKLNNLDH